jgi:lysophospholipase L1-like esterase
MSFRRMVCPVLTLAVFAAGCSQSPTAPTALALDERGSLSQAASPVSNAATNSASTAINPPRGLGVTRLVAFGDSITFGVMSANDGSYLYASANGGYVEQLEGDLNLLHQPQRFSVTNDGLPGELAVSAVPRFRSMLTTRRPEGVLLLEGINDLSNGFSPSTTVNALRQMLDAAAQIGVPVAIATMYQTYEATHSDGSVRENGAASVPAFNAAVRALVPGRLNVALVDLEPVMRDRQFVGGDGLHPTEAGFDVMASAFRRVIEAAYPVRGSFQ